MSSLPMPGEALYRRGTALGNVTKKYLDRSLGRMDKYMPDLPVGRRRMSK